MITHPGRRRVRHRSLLYGTTAVLCGMTIALTTLSVVGYIRYQQLAAEARTAATMAREVERFASEMGLWTTDGDLQLNCAGWCTIALKPSTDSTSKAGRSEYLRITSKLDGDCEMPVDIFRDRHVEIPIVHRGQSALPDGPIPCADFNSLVGAPGSDGQTRTIAVIQDIDSIDRIDFFDSAHEAIISIQVSFDSRGKLHLTAPSTADADDQAVENAMKNLLAASGGALIAFFAMSAFGWMAARGRFASRRTPQRRGATGSEIRQQPPCDKAWTDRLTMGLIASAVRALDHPDDQDRYGEEWSADSDEIPGKWQRLRWALVLRLCAPMGIRSARRSALSMSSPQQQ